MPDTITTLLSTTGPWGGWLRTPIATACDQVLRGLQLPESLTRLVIELGPPAADTLSWSPAARGMATDAIHAALEWAGPRGITLHLRPDAGHIISDIPSTLAMLRSEPRLLLALEPMALLTEAMKEHRALHLERIRSAFGAHPQRGCVIGKDGEEMAGYAAPVVWTE